LLFPEIHYFLPSRSILKGQACPSLEDTGIAVVNAFVFFGFSASPAHTVTGESLESFRGSLSAFLGTVFAFLLIWQMRFNKTINT
jgi:hypothetical protein